MPKLHLRTFQKKVNIDGDGTVVFPGPVELNEGIIPTGGTLTYEANGTDLQTQITANSTAVTALQSSGHAHVDTIVFVDSNRAGETYTETGTELAPYRTLSAAVNVKLANGQTAYVVFQLAAGTYTETIFRDKDTKEQEFEIRGSGKNNTILQASASWDGSAGNVLEFRDFLTLKIRDLTIQQGKYGIYTRDCAFVHIENVSFKILGSSGANHVWGGGNNQAAMAAFWAARGANGIRSDGGAMRIRESAQVIVKNCDSSGTLRGFRLQNCGQGRVSGCTVRFCLESAFYCASTSYTAANNDGCHNIIFETCRAEYCWNNAFLVIGGYDISIIGCQAQNVANSAVMGWHTQDLRVQGCVFNKTCLLSYNGIGNPGADAYGCVGFLGNSGLTDTEGYMLTCVNNIMLRTGQGRHTEPVAFFFGLLDETLTSFRAIIDSNNIDTPTITYMDDSVIPLTKTKYPATATQEEFDNLSTTVVNNTTAVALNGTNITTVQGNIATNATSITTNETDILGKQTTLTWSTVADNHESNPVTSRKIKEYVDANAGGGGGDVYLANVNTFTANQEIKANSNVKLTLEHTGYGFPLELGNNYGDAGLTYVGKSSIKFNGNRIAMSGGCTMLQMPVVTSLDTTNASHSCLCVKDDKLYYNKNGTWKEIKLHS